MSEVVIVGVDGSQAGVRAAHFAAAHVGRQGAEVVVAYVVPWSPYTPQTAADNERRSITKKQEVASAHEHIVDPIVTDLADQGVRAEAVVRHGHPAETLCALAAERGARHLVVGRRGQSTVKTLLFGSTPGSLIQTSPVPVTVVP